METISRLPPPPGVDVATGLGRLLPSVKLVKAEILAVCDETETSPLTSERWVMGWDVPLHKRSRKALTSAQGNTSELPRLIEGCFRQVRNHLNHDNKGPSAFKLLLRLLTSHFDTGDQSLGFTQLHSYGVPTNTDFAVFFRGAKDVVSIVQGTERIIKPTDAMVVEYFRLRVSQQFPALMPILCPGSLMTTPEPYATVQDLWTAFEVLATNKTPAINGNKFPARTSCGHTTYSSTNPAPAQRHR